MRKLTIIIVNWNTGRMLSDCLNSIMSLPDASLICEVIVVDNDSTDKSLLDAVKISKNAAIVISFHKLSRNLGFAAANNIGISNRQDKKSHLLLLNPDTKVTPASIQLMLKELDNNPQVGIVGPKLLNLDGTAQASVRNFPTFINLIFIILKLDKIFPTANSWQKYLQVGFNYDIQQKVDQLMGAAFLIKRECFNKVGLLDEGFRLWFEEVDFAKRAANLGWTSLYVPKSRITHIGAVSFNQLVGLKKTFPWIKSAIHYAQNHFPLWQVLLLYLIAPFGLMLTLPSSLFHRIQLKKNSKYL
jgi:GT2 family glycosyltransferase